MTRVVSVHPSSSARHRRPALQGVSLLEVMVVVAMIGILSAMAVPQLLPVAQRAELSGAAHAVASFVAAAQMEAISRRRCVRVRIAATGNDVQDQLVSEVLNTFDCDVNPATAPKIDADAALWVPLQNLYLDKKSLLVAFDPAPPETNPGPGGDVPELRFRPSGRLFSKNLDVVKDDGVLKVTHQVSGASKKILVESHGPLCVLPENVTPTANAGGGYDCP